MASQKHVGSDPVGTHPQGVRERLLQMLDSALQRQSRLAEHVEHRQQPLPADFAEQAVELENEETMVQLAAQMNEEVAAVKFALQRLDDGTYDTCVHCQSEIDSGRLQALPATTSCIRCAESAA